METGIKQKLKAEAFWTYARSGAFQRAKIYSKNANDEQKDNFRKLVKKFLFDEIFLKFQQAKITENKLIILIEKLILACKGNKAIDKNKLRFGNAQKFINLYLKAMWVTDCGKEPPHFPVDRIVMRELKLMKLTINWTNMDKSGYEKVIGESKKIIKKNITYSSIATWEAEFYQKKYIDVLK